VDAFENQDLTTMRYLNDVYKDTSPQKIALYSILVRAQVRRRICELLYPVMTDVLKHGPPYDTFDFKRINFTEPPSVHTTHRSVVRRPNRSVESTTRLTGESEVEMDVMPELPDLNIIFSDDVVERQQITNFNWVSNATLTVSYYRSTYLNPDYDETKGQKVGAVFRDDSGEISRLPYDSVVSGSKLFSKNFLVEDLEAACLFFDLEIQRHTQILPHVTDVQLQNVTYRVPAETDKIYGSLEMEYNVNYQTDYKCLERKEK